MMTQSVMTQAANLFGNAAGSVTTKGKQNGSNFGLIIDDSLKSIQDCNRSSDMTTTRKAAVEKSETRKNDISDKSDAATKQMGTDKTDTAANVEETNKTLKTKDTQTAENGAANRTDGTKAGDKTDEGKEDSAATVKQMLAQILELLQSIRQAAMETLEMNSEEFDRLMLEQGMGITDLLAPENLQKLVLANSGETNILAALTDENLADTMQQLLSTVQAMKEEAGVTLTEEQLNAILEEAKELGLQQTEGWLEQQAGLQTLAEKDLNKVKQEDAKQMVAANAQDEISSNQTGSRAEQNLDSLGQSEITNVTGAEEENQVAQDHADRKDSSEAEASDEFQAFVDNMVKVSKDVMVDYSGNMVQVTELRDIANQIIERIRVSITPEQSQMELQLNPEHLGKVHLTVQSKNDVMTAQFIVQNEISKEAIESQLQTLKDALNQQGIKVEMIEVTVASYSLEQNSGENAQSQTDEKSKGSGKKITLEEAMTMTEIPDQEELAQDITGIRGSWVDYTA